MTFRISQIATVCGLSLLTMPGAMLAQAPRYQSPYTAPAATAQPQTSALPAPAAVTPNGVVVEDIIVRVNDQIISRSDLERSQQQLQQEMQQNNVPPDQAAEAEKNLLRDMIDKQLMLSRAKELGLNADSEVVRRLDEIRKQYKLDTLEDLEKAARQQGISYEDFKANIRDGILEQQVVRDEVGRRLQMTQGQEQAYYDAHKQDFEQPEQIRLSEILVPTPADAKDDVIAQAQARANDIAAQIKAGAKFDELAKKVSGGPTAAQGGDLNYFKRGALAKVLEDQTFGLKAGESTAPIRTRQGFVILKVTEHQPAGVQPLKDVEPQVQEAMYMEQLQPALRVYMTKLREDAYIDIKPGFVDTGASPKQTKPVFTAYTAPVPKKKTVVEKQRFDRGGKFSTVAKNEAPPAGSAGSATGSAAGGSTAGAAATAGATTDVAATTPTTPTPAAAAKTVSSSKATSGKQKKIKREKVRFGQAPRNSLPAGPEDTLTDKGLGLSASEGPGAAAAPGAAMAPGESTTTITPSSDPDPLTPKPVSTGKTRYAARAKTEAATKAANKTAKAQDKAKATPVAATTDEKEAQAAQSAPLGLNGDTAKKKKKEKVKGESKERIQEKPKEPAKPAPEPMPYRNPPPATPGSAPAPAAPADTTTPAAPTMPAPPAAPTK